MICKSSIETCTLPCVKQMTSVSLMYKVGHPKLCDNLEGQDMEGGGREFQDEGDTCTYGQFMLMYGKNNHNTVK